MANQHETISRADCLTAAAVFLAQSKLTEWFANENWAFKVAGEISQLASYLYEREGGGRWSPSPTAPPA